MPHRLPRRAFDPAPLLISLHPPHLFFFLRLRPLCGWALEPFVPFCGPFGEPPAMSFGPMSAAPLGPPYVAFGPMSDPPLVPVLRGFDPAAGVESTLIRPGRRLPQPTTKYC